MSFRYQPARQRPAGRRRADTAGRPVRLSTWNGQSAPGSVRSSPARGIAGQIVANTSLLIAVLVYMGWAYDDALYGYFHLNPLDLNIGVVEYMLRSLDLFSTAIVIVAAVIIAATSVRAWGLGRTKFVRLAATTAAARISAFPAVRRLASPHPAERARARQTLLIGAGATLTLTALALYRIANYVHISTYLFLGVLGGGVLLLTWPARADRRGRFPYAMAVVVAAVSALWAASIYAHNLGTEAAKQDVQSLSTRTAVVVYSMDPLALSGPGLTVQRLPATFHYHYRYQGLRLLLMRSGTYYLLPVGWRPQLDYTYILNQSDPIRIELMKIQP